MGVASLDRSEQLTSRDVKFSILVRSPRSCRTPTSINIFKEPVKKICAIIIEWIDIMASESNVYRTGHNDTKDTKDRHPPLPVPVVDWTADDIPTVNINTTDIQYNFDTRYYSRNPISQTCLSGIRYLFAGDFDLSREFPRQKMVYRRRSPKRLRTRRLCPCISIRAPSIYKNKYLQ